MAREKIVLCDTNILIDALKQDEDIQIYFRNEII